MSHTIGYVPPVIGGINSSAGAGATWGDIYGNIANQTDLITQLDLKLDADEKGVANGVATLDANGYVPLAQLPVTVITEVFVVEDEAEMLALTAQVGDVAVRQDESQSYILQGSDPTVLGNWVVLLSPTSDVTSVNGQVGPVLLDADDIDDSATAHKFVTATQVGLIDTSIQPDNVALTNAREWTASTVPQAEAEAGTATTRRAWTAQRVFQAIAAWWNASAAKTKLDGIQSSAEVNQNAFSTVFVTGLSGVDADSKTSTLTLTAGAGMALTPNSSTDTITFAVSTVPVANGGTGATTASGARTNLGLGTAATATLTTSPSDTTTGRVVQVGDYGLGRGPIAMPNQQYNDLTVPGTYFLNSTTAGNNPPITSAPFLVTVATGSEGGVNTRITQEAVTYGVTPSRYFRRGFNGTSWTAWDEIYHSGSVIPVANGGTGATTASAARTNLGLGDSATLNTGTTAGTVATGDHTHAAATTSVAGFMSAADKTKLEQIAGTLVPYVKLELEASTGLVTVLGSSTGITATIDHQTDASDLVMSFVFGANSGLIRPPTQVSMYVDYGGSGYWACYPSWHANGFTSLGSTYLITSSWSDGNFPLTSMTLQQIQLRPFAVPSSSDRVAYLFFN